MTASLVICIPVLWHTWYLPIDMFPQTPLYLFLQLTQNQLVQLLRDENKYVDCYSVYLLVTIFQSSHRLLPTMKLLLQHTRLVLRQRQVYQEGYSETFSPLVTWREQPGGLGSEDSWDPEARDYVECSKTLVKMKYPQFIGCMDVKTKLSLTWRRYKIWRKRYDTIQELKGVTVSWVGLI